MRQVVFYLKIKYNEFMKINRLIDDYEPLLLEKEARKILKDQKILIKVEAQKPLEVHELLSIDVNKLLFFITEKEISDGSYIQFLEEEQIPLITDLFDFSYILFVEEFGERSVVLKGELERFLNGKCRIEPNFTEWISENSFPNFFIEMRFSLKQGLSIDNYFSNISIKNMYEERLKTSVKLINKYSADLIPKHDRLKKINFNYETKDYRFFDFGLKNFEKFSYLSKFLFRSIKDEDLLPLINNSNYAESRPILKSNEIEILYQNVILPEYDSIFKLIGPR